MIYHRVSLVEQELSILPDQLLFCGVHVAQYLVFCVVFCMPLFVRYSLVIALSVVRFMASDYFFGVFTYV